MPHKIGAYLRVSTEEQAAAVEGSLDNQRYRLKAYVDSKNIQEKSWGKIVDFYVDDGYSAKDTNRPAYQRMLLDLKNKKIDLIVVPDLSRLSRNLLDFCGLLSFLEKHKSEFLSIKEQFDTSTSIGRMMVYQIITLAQFEREQTSERVALGAHARAMRGLLNGGRSILGFDKDPTKPGTYVVNPSEAKIVRRIFELYLEQGSKSRTIRKLNELGIQPKCVPTLKGTTRQRDWTVENLGYLLSNATYSGHLEVNKRRKALDQESLKPHHRYQVVKAPWPAIVSDDLFNKVQGQLETGKLIERTRLQGSSPRLYILSGIFKCAECGESLVGQSYHGSNAVFRYYGHTTKGSKNGCKVQRVSADVIEDAVIKYLRDSLVDSNHLKQLQAKLNVLTARSTMDYTEQAEKLKTELSLVEQEATNIFRMQGQGDFGSEVLKMMSERLEVIAKLKNQYIESLKMFESMQNDVDGASESAQFIRSTIVDFDKGFDKAPMGLKKRLVRNTLKQVVLAHDKLAFWFFTNPDEKGSEGRKLHLVRDEQSEVGVSLVSGDSFGPSNLSVRRLDIGKLGDAGTTRTFDLLLRRQLLYPAELRHHD
jgi:site-specific DNA recombinase